MRNNKYNAAFLIIISMISCSLFAQDNTPSLKLTFEKKDTLHICKVFVSLHDSALGGVDVKLFVQRMFTQLPIGHKATNDEGVASITFPNNIPADRNGKLTVIAKIIDDDNFANAESKSEVALGVIRQDTGSQVSNRSFSASRDRAPISLIVIANLIILGVWGTLIYVISLVFKLKAAG